MSLGLVFKEWVRVRVKEQLEISRLLGTNTRLRRVELGYRVCNSLMGLLLLALEGKIQGRS